LTMFDADFADSLRHEVLSAQGDVAGFCRWFDALLDALGLDPIAALVAHRLLPQARDDAQTERRRQGATQAARERIIAETREALRRAARRQRDLSATGAPGDHRYYCDRRACAAGAVADPRGRSGRGVLAGSPLVPRRHGHAPGQGRVALAAAARQDPRAHRLN